MIQADMMAKLKRSLIKHEEKKNFPYVDTVGKITIGIGYNLTDRGLPDSWIDSQFLQDVSYFYQKLMEFPWFKDLNPDRQIVLIDMSFMGWAHFLEFHEMLDALAIHNYQQAAYCMIQSKWALQVKGRATQLAHGMLTGEYNV
jgi:lysozyme